MIFPAECPAFEYAGNVYEGRPGIFAMCVDEEAYITLVGDEGVALVCVGDMQFGNQAPFSSLTPLTDAAWDLLEWAVTS